jgi:hypothetical protein
VLSSQTACKAASHGRSSKNAPNPSDFAVGLALCFPLPAPSLAQESGLKVYSKKDSYEDVKFELQNAIVSRGLVVDYRS